MNKSNISECPNCGSNMTLSKAPFLYHGSYIGLFEAYKCSFCHRVYFTEMAYNEIMSTPVSLNDFTQFEDSTSNLLVQQENLQPVLKLTKKILLSDSDREDAFSTDEEQIFP